MVWEAVRQCAPGVLDRCVAETGETPGRSELLCTLLETEGARQVMDLIDHYPVHPETGAMFFLFVNSPSPAALIRKLTKYDRYLHPRRRMELCTEGENFVIVENTSPPSAELSVADELFACGTVRGLLKRIGCQRVRVTWESVRSESYHGPLGELGMHPPPVEKHSRWRFEWDAFNRPPFIPGLDEFFLAGNDSSHRPGARRFPEKIAQLVTKRLSDRPTASEIAEELNVSVRTLQRKLREHGTSYSEIYQASRLKSATHLLESTTLTITEIGFMTGFSDTAHFSREFKRATRRSPMEFRRDLMKPTRQVGTGSER